MQAEFEELERRQAELRERIANAWVHATKARREARLLREQLRAVFRATE